MSEEKKSWKERQNLPDDDGLIHFHDMSFDFEDYFNRYESGTMCEEEKEEFSARVMGLFCRDSFDSGTVKPWVANYIAEKLYEALGGVPWSDIMGLPWDERTSYLTPKGERAFETYAYVHNTQLEQPDARITDLIAEAAKKLNVSFETARADYYAMKSGIGKKTGIPSRFLKETP